MPILSRSERCLSVRAATVRMSPPRYGNVQVRVANQSEPQTIVRQTTRFWPVFLRRTETKTEYGQTLAPAEREAKVGFVCPEAVPTDHSCRQALSITDINNIYLSGIVLHVIPSKQFTLIKL